jgi:hypothetical protein
MHDDDNDNDNEPIPALTPAATTATTDPRDTTTSTIPTYGDGRHYGDGGRIGVGKAVQQ